jgi:regulatory protein
MEPQATRTLVRVREEPGAVILELDSGETLAIAPDAVPDQLPAAGGSLSSPLLASLREAAARKLAARRLLELLDRRLWTTARLRRKLLEEGHPPEAADAVIARAEAQGLHSDRQYATAFCRDTLRRKAVGRGWLETRLREKGIAAELAADCAALALPADRERELALAAATGRWRRERGRDARAEARVLRFLGSRGFAPGLCRDAVRAGRTAAGAADAADASCNSPDEGPS